MRAHELIRLLQRFPDNSEVWVGIEGEDGRFIGHLFFHPKQCLAIHTQGSVYLVPPADPASFPLIIQPAWTEPGISLMLRKEYRRQILHSEDGKDPGVILGNGDHKP